MSNLELSNEIFKDIFNFLLTEEKRLNQEMKEKIDDLKISPQTFTLTKFQQKCYPKDFKTLATIHLRLSHKNHHQRICRSRFLS